MPVSMLFFGVISVAVLVYFNLMDKKTQKWRKIEGKRDLYAYVAFHGAIILGIVGTIFELYLKGR
ncbi:hypothetical protein RFN25_07045 [Mesorhizobium abyssinicae]|uniref:hypothetical protein n=1 Tax=Mesorhizobium abyssinicae TaxID=1209958 RepID=UPI002A2455A2|nr:hypothetical protein [Mesorhizobium abyssinicae]MDX8433189.1 hypothetical protein [Mesorhizobium abyssinicae]